jgi:hypothetical protein
MVLDSFFPARGMSLTRRVNTSRRLQAMHALVYYTNNRSGRLDPFLWEVRFTENDRCDASIRLEYRYA